MTRLGLPPGKNCTGLVTNPDGADDQPRTGRVAFLPDRKSALDTYGGRIVPCEVDDCDELVEGDNGGVRLFVPREGW